MKQSDNNQIDILLRSLARHGGTNDSTPGDQSGTGAGGVHLDADELNSYAEDALPQAARARYTAHIADCERCRRVVTQITLAAGAGARRETIEQRTRLTFWQHLGAFFSSSALRYAIPALALFALITVGVVTWRQQRRSQFVAQNEAARSQVVPEQINQLKKEPESNAPAATANHRSTPAVSTVSNPAAVANKTPNAGDKLDAGQTAGSGTASSVAPAKQAPQPAEGFIAADKPTYAPESKAALAPTSPQAKPADSEKTRAAANEQPARRDIASQKEEDAKTRSKDETTDDRSDRSETESVSGSRVFSAEEKRQGVVNGRLKKKADNDAETRTVSGRHFRRQDNAWIDTTYVSPRATINVARGSEQYRALVADEPGIRTVAEALSGEVVVVWKGRAYRIH